MTEAEAAWLRKLRNEGPQNLLACDGETSTCLVRGWTSTDDNHDLDTITPAGLAALAEHEEKGQ